MSQLFFKNYPAAISQTWKAHFTVTVNAHCATTHNSNGKGQRSRSHKAEDRFGGLVEALFSTPLGRAAFLVDRGTAHKTYQHAAHSAVETCYHREAMHCSCSVITTEAPCIALQSTYASLLLLLSQHIEAWATELSQLRTPAGMTIQRILLPTIDTSRLTGSAVSYAYREL